MRFIQFVVLAAGLLLTASNAQAQQSQAVTYKGSFVYLGSGPFVSTDSQPFVATSGSTTVTTGYRSAAIATWPGNSGASTNRLDCRDIGHRVIVTGADPNHLDADHDGIGCEDW